MTVHVRQKQGSGAGALALSTQWIDEFSDVSTTPFRNNYLYHSTTDDTDFALATAGGNLSMTGGITTSSVLGVVPLALGAIRGLEQFSEVTLVTATVSNRTGPAVLINGDGRSSNLGGFNSCYHLINVAAIPGGNLQIQSEVNNNVLTNIGAAFAGAAIGDRIALAVRFSGVSNIFEVYFNGVSQGTRTDAAPTATRAGLPGIQGGNLVNGSVFSISRLRCGHISRLGY
jgi:hypothetical protein